MVCDLFRKDDNVTFEIEAARNYKDMFQQEVLEVCYDGANKSVAAVKQVPCNAIYMGYIRQAEMAFEMHGSASLDVQEIL